MADTRHTRDWVRDVVRSGLWSAERVRAEVAAAVAADHPGLPAEETADRWIGEALDEWRAEAEHWPATTDHDRLARAFAGLAERGILVLEGVEDHWAAGDALRRCAPAPRGVAWFLPTDVWHAIDAGMLEVNLWHASTANVAPGDALLVDALEAFAAAGLEAHYDEGRIEVAARWQRRP